MESIKKKKMSYVYNIPKNRLLATLFRFDIAILLFLLLGLLVGQKYSLKTVMLSLIGWSAVGNSNWYIFVILLLYVITYISFMIFKDKKNYIPGILCVLLLSVLYIVLIMTTKVKGSFWCDTVLCYPLGMFYSVHKERIEKAVNKNRFIYYLMLLSLILLFLFLNYFVNRNISFVIDLVQMLAFVMMVVIATMRFSFDNKILYWLGNHLFEIYILQRIPFILFKHYGINNNIYLYMFLCIVSTALLAWGFKKACDALWNLIKPRIKEFQK
jgi:membrane-bound acyltransferase YfiQ involved in biofilm formation